MIKQCFSTSEKNEKFSLLARIRNESDAKWLKRAYDDLELNNSTQWSYIVLTGSKGISAFRIRTAQGHLRSDMLPSYWSDCGFLEVSEKEFADSNFYNLPLLQPETESYAPIRNGLIKSSLSYLLNSHKFPNIALLAIPVTQKDIVSKLEIYQKSRIAYDAVENIIPWLSYVWGIHPNPLLQQIGFPSAMLLNHLYGASNFDLSPSINNNLSTPEVFWNGAKNWKEFYSSTVGDSLLPRGRFIIDHAYDIDESKENLSRSKQNPAPRNRK